ncbi:MAG: methyltransferase domain-containing protein [candidate division Zixibacteria bacterium]|nr:methyltransferase domain-containing protein [candidate division Zixibacteria bacterium]
MHTDIEYDPDNYWETRGGPSYKAYTESRDYQIYRGAQAAFFEELLGRLQPQRLLDFGCGSGKSFPLWCDVPEVHGYDRARSQIEVARAEMLRIRPERPYNLMHCLTDSRTEVPYDDDYFDVVAAVEVFLHVLPTELPALLDELNRICRGHLAIITAAPFENRAAHCFNHDYQALLKGRFDIVDDYNLHKQRYIVARKLPLTTRGEQTAPLADLITQ